MWTPAMSRCIKQTKWFKCVSVFFFSFANICISKCHRSIWFHWECVCECAGLLTLWSFFYRLSTLFRSQNHRNKESYSKCVRLGFFIRPHRADCWQTVWWFFPISCRMPSLIVAFHLSSYLHGRQSTHTQFFSLLHPHVIKLNKVLGVFVCCRVKLDIWMKFNQSKNTECCSIIRRESN